MMKIIEAFFFFWANAPKFSEFCPHNVYMCFVRISEQTAIISVLAYSILTDWFLQQRRSVCILRYELKL